MPENCSEPSGMPPHPHPEQWIRDTLTRIEAKIDALDARITDAEGEAEEILRRVTPAGARPSRRRGGHRAPGLLFLVKVAVIATATLGIIVAGTARSVTMLHQEQYSPHCTVQCSQPVAHHSVTRHR